MRHPLSKQTNNPFKAIGFIATCFVLLMIPFIFTGCERDKPQDYLIRSIDMEAMALKHLPDFELIYQRQNWIFYEYLFKRPNDNVEIILRINFCNSKADTDSIVNVYFSDISAYYSEGPFKGESVGEKFWWSTFTSIEYPSSIAFIRDNLVFVLNEYGYSELISLAKKLITTYYTRLLILPTMTSS